MRCLACGDEFAVGAPLSQHAVKAHPAFAVSLLIEAYTEYGAPEACWPWLGTRSAKGYPLLVIGRHQVVVTRLLIDVAEDQDACHRCDNPPCVNPLHLFAGSRADNQADKAAKGRSARGETNGGGGRLTDADVRTIRSLLDAGELTKAAIARRFGVSGTQIGHIATGRQWRHVT